MTIQEKLEQARNNYRPKLLQRLAELEQLLSRLDQEVDEESLAAAQRLAHRVCGSAGSFGFDRTGEAVKVIDQTLLSLLEGLLVPSPAVWDVLAERLAAARRACEP